MKKIFKIITTSLIMGLLTVGTLVPIASAESVAPTNLTDYIVSDIQINLNWYSVPGAISYSVYQSTNNGAYRRIAFNVIHNYERQIPVTPGTNYSYYVTAVDSSGEGPASNVVSLTTP
ncbi:MAG: fibronectin type III domain-containing protein [Gammaproteobacteria bacterium]|nr:fibronectin type III domain-containing protein [Gammaproteobacteria bacterium]